MAKELGLKGRIKLPRSYHFSLLVCLLYSKLQQAIQVPKAKIIWLKLIGSASVLRMQIFHNHDDQRSAKTQL